GKLSDLAKARVKAGEMAYNSLLRKLKAFPGARFDATLYTLSVQILHAQRDLDSTRESTIKAYQAHLERMQDVEKLVTELFRAGAGEGPKEVVEIFETFRLEAEYWLEQARQRK